MNIFKLKYYEYKRNSIDDYLLTDQAALSPLNSLMQ